MCHPRATGSSSNDGLDLAAWAAAVCVMLRAFGRRRSIEQIHRSGRPFPAWKCHRDGVFDATIG